jgi:hypothetical protein
MTSLGLRRTMLCVAYGSIQKSPSPRPPNSPTPSARISRGGQWKASWVYCPRRIGDDTELRPAA